jgi:hypothetical protein
LYLYLYLYYFIKPIFYPRNESDSIPQRLYSKTSFYKTFIKKQLLHGQSGLFVHYGTLYISRTSRTGFYISKMPIRRKNNSSLHKCTYTLKILFRTQVCLMWLWSRVAWACGNQRLVSTGKTTFLMATTTFMFLCILSDRFINYKATKVIFSVPFKQCC